MKSKTRDHLKNESLYELRVFERYLKDSGEKVSKRYFLFLDWFVKSRDSKYLEQYSLASKYLNSRVKMKRPITSLDKIYDYFRDDIELYVTSANKKKKREI